MHAPPRISEASPKVVELEVVQPAKEGKFTRTRSDGAPIHALSALAMLAVDSLWAVFIWEPPVWIVTIPFCFIATFVPVYLIQRHLRKDPGGRALAYATLLGILAGL